MLKFMKATRPVNALQPKTQNCTAGNEQTSILSSIPRRSLKKKKTTTITSTSLKYGCSKMQCISQPLSPNSKIYLEKAVCWHFLERSRTQWHQSVLGLVKNGHSKYPLKKNDQKSIKVQSKENDRKFSKINYVLLL